jgi:hypothetical protein
MVAAVSMVKDEADVVELTVGRMARSVDVVLVADNGSTDATRAILEEIENVLVVDDAETGYFQSRKMTRLALQAAATFGAEWVIPFDADEVWLPTQGARIADLLDGMPEEALIAEAVVLDHVATPGDHVLSPWRRSEVLPLRKVAVRVRPDLTIHQGNHAATFESAARPLTVTGQLEVRHFPHRSAEQMIRKARNGAAAYAATNLPADVGAHWRQWGELTDEQLREVFHEFYFSADPEADGLVYDPCP